MENKESKINLGLVLTILPFIGYLLAFTIELGHASHFAIPFLYITVKIELILFITFLLITVLLAIYIIIEVILQLLPNKFREIDSLPYFILSFVLLLITFFIQLFVEINTISIIIMVVIFSVIIIRVIFFLITNKDKSRSFGDKLFDIIVYDSLKNTIFDKIFKKYKKQLMIPIILIIYLICALFIIGNVLAENTTSFWILNQDSTHVVVGIYGENIVLCNTDEVKSKDIKLVKIVNTNNLNSYILTPYELNFNENIETIKLPEIDTIKNVESNSSTTNQ